jgi:hypothetical protein
MHVKEGTMRPDTPITLAAAKYVNRAHALEDWQAVEDAKRFGDFDHMVVAVLSKDSDGMLQVERNDTTPQHLAWVGAAVVVIEAAELLESGQAGLVVVAVNREGSAVEPLLVNAEKLILVETVVGDLDAVMEKELAKAKAGV